MSGPHTSTDERAPRPRRAARDPAGRGGPGLRRAVGGAGVRPRGPPPRARLLHLARGDRRARGRGRGRAAAGRRGAEASPPAVRLHGRGCSPWREWTDALAAEIGAARQRGDTTTGYYA